MAKRHQACATFGSACLVSHKAFEKIGLAVLASIGLAVAACATQAPVDGQASSLSPNESTRPTEPQPPDLLGECRAGKDGVPPGSESLRAIDDTTNIELRCHPQNHDCRILNKTASTTVMIDGYSIIGAATLVPASWVSIRDVAVATPSLVTASLGSGALGFQEITTPTSNVLAEFHPSGSGQWGPGTVWSVGSVFGTTNPSARMAGSEFFYTTPGAGGAPGVVYKARITEDPIVTSLAGGGIFGSHFCATRFDGRTKCWGLGPMLGLGDYQQRGDQPSDMGDALPFVDLGTARTSKSLGAGLGTTCAVLDNDKLKCWGVNQLGLGDTLARGAAPNQMGDALPFVDLGTGRTVKAVKAGLNHACAILDNDSVKCWGGNTVGNLGLGDTVERGNAAGQMGNALPAVDLGTGRSAKAVSLGFTHTCAILDNDRVKCWGNNEFGELGVGDTVARGHQSGSMGENLPYADLGAGHTAKKLAAGYHYACAILDDDTIKCWGREIAGGATPSGSLVGLSGHTAKAISTAISHTCAILDNDQVGCWGSNANGELGCAGANTNSVAVVTLANLGTGRTAKAIATGHNSTCALLDNGKVKCWGANGFGQLGVGDTADRGGSAGQMGDALPYVDLGN